MNIQKMANYRKTGHDIRHIHKYWVKIGVPPWNGQWQKHHWGFKPVKGAPTSRLSHNHPNKRTV